MEKQSKAAILAAAFLLPVLFGLAGTPAGAADGRNGGRTDAGSQAEAAARSVLGSGTALERAETGPFVLFSCRNGYVLADPADGRVVEYALSFPGKPPVLVRPEQPPDPDSGSGATK